MKASLKPLMILIICVCGSYVALAQNLAITNLVVDVDTENVLRYNVQVNTTDSANVYIKYSYSENGNVYEQVSQVSANKLEHHIKLIGFRATTGYTLQAFAFNNSEQVSSAIENFITGTLPFNVDNNSGNVAFNNIDRQEFVIYHKIMSGSDRHFKIIDSEGAIVWYDYYTVLVQNCNAWRLSKNNTILYGDCHVLHERDFFGNDIAIIPYASPSTNFHHDLMILDDGNYAVIYVQARDLDLSSVGGTIDQRVAGDGYLVFDSAGNIINEWNVFDYYFPESAMQQGSYWNAVYGQNTLDWTHINSIEEDSDGNFLLSVSHWDKVIKVNRTTDEVMWEFGESAQIPTPSVFDYQHALTNTANNQYMLFDNLGLVGRSRVLEFSIDPINFTATQIWEYVPDDPFVAFVMGNANRLENGNTLINFGLAAAIQEVDESGELLWDFRVGVSNYRAYKVPYLNEPHPEVIVSLPDTVCLFDEPFLIESNLAQTYVTGNGVENGWFNPALAGAGNHVVAGFYGTSIDQDNIVVLDAPNPTVQENDLTLTVEEGYNNYQWYVNGEAIETANNSSISVFDSGLYYATMLGDNGCPGYSDTLNLIIANVLEQMILDVNITYYKHYIHIENKTNKTLYFKLFDAAGSVIMNQSIDNGFNQIETKQLAAGISIAQIESDNLKLSKKIIIQ